MAILHTHTHTHSSHTSHFTLELQVLRELRVCCHLIEMPANLLQCTVPHQLRAQIPNDSTISSHTHRTSLSGHCHCHYALKGLVAKFNFLHLNGFAANIHNCCNILWHPELHAQLPGIACCLVIVSTKPLNVTKCFVSSPPPRQSISTMGNQFPYLTPQPPLKWERLFNRYFLIS